MKKLHKVICEFYAVIDTADDETAAAHLLVGAVGPDESDVDAFRVDSVPPSWKNANPFGESEGLTCQQWLDKDKSQ